MKPSNVIVARGLKAISDPGYLALSIGSVLPGSSFSDLRDHVVGALEKRGKREFDNIHDLIDAIDEIVTRLRDSEPEVFSAHHVDLALRQTQQCRHLISANSKAYDVDYYRYPDAVYWPDPTSNRDPRNIYETKPIAKSYPIVSRKTSVGSAGSCFATEIARNLKSRGFNYLTTEENVMASARWGIIFNAPSFRGLIEFAFGIRERPLLAWRRTKKKGLLSKEYQYLDPFREDIEFNSVDEMERDYPQHKAAARKALETAEVFILTLGMNEVWYLTADGTPISRCPWALAPHLVEKRVLTVEDNVRELQKMLDIWRSFNPGLKLIVTVSPVPLHATFRADENHVIAANHHSKSVLRVAAEKFCNANPSVYYFPSFEQVMYCTREPWSPDQRHVSRAAVDGVMALFDEMFVVSEN